jgi:hypothetical protein
MRANARGFQGFGRAAISSKMPENRLQKRQTTSAAKAAIESNPVIAALKRCATQKHVRHRLFPLNLSG